MERGELLPAEFNREFTKEISETVSYPLEQGNTFYRKNQCDVYFFLFYFLRRIMNICPLLVCTLRKNAFKIYILFSRLSKR